MSIFGSTANGATAYKSTGNALINLFFNIGAARNNANGIKNDFDAAMAFDMRKAAAMLLYARDIRHDGAGERNVFRVLFKELIASDEKLAEKVLRLIPDCGRFDDLEVAFGTSLESIAVGIWADALRTNNALAFKWIDRSNVKVRKAMGFKNEAEFRKFISKGRAGTIVEEKMCSNHWNRIEFGKLPSVAGARYAKAFKKHDADRFSKFMADKGTKVNSSVNFPHDIYRLFKASGSDRDVQNAANKYWENLAALDVAGNILVIPDVSGSMTCRASGSISCLDVAVSLGVFLAQRIKGAFNGKLITFSERPTIVNLPQTNDLGRLFSFVEHMDWGGSTNFQAAFEAILADAKRNNVAKEDMPSMLLVMSDMQFNPASINDYHNNGSLFGNSRNRTTAETTLHSVMKEKFEAFGYTIPKILYWNLNGAYGNFPTMSNEGDVALVSGFSPKVLKAVLASKSFSPGDIMEEAIAPFLAMLDK